MKRDWESKALSDVCTIKPPKSEVRNVLNESDMVSFIPMEDLQISSKTFPHSTSRPLSDVIKSYTYFAENDVLLAKITPCFENGKLGIAKDLINGVGFGSSEFLVFRPSKELSNEWLYYFLAQSSFREEGTARMTGAVGHKRVAKEFIENYLIPIPALDEQKRIVSILDKSFEAIDITKANTEKNLQNARALFESYLNEAFANPDTSFIVKKLGDVCTFIGGSQPPKSIFSKSELPNHVRLIQIRDYKSSNHKVFIPLNKARRFCDSNDVMIGRYGPPVFQILRGLEGAYNVALMKAVPDTKLLTYDYLFYFLRHSNIQKYVIYHSQRAAGQSGLNKDTLEPYTINLPNIDFQNSTVNKVVELEEKLNSIENTYKHKLQLLEELKKSLLHQAFSGGL